jgi:IPT/TIG domain
LSAGDRSESISSRTSGEKLPKKVDENRFHNVSFSNHSPHFVDGSFAAAARLTSSVLVPGERCLLAIEQLTGGWSLLMRAWLRQIQRPFQIGRRQTKHLASARPLQVEVLEDRALPSLMGNNLFPADNPWNQKITNAPVAANSATLVASIGATAVLHPDFGTMYGGALNDIPYNIVSGTQPKVPVVVDEYPSESDLLPIPIPANVVIEGDPLTGTQNTSDRHMLIYDSDNNIVYETFNTRRPSETADQQWHAGSEAVWDLKKDSFRTPGYTSADAAGLPVLPGLVRPDEVLQQGGITHALRFTVPRTQEAYIYPASHEAGQANTSLPRMGERFRLKASVDISQFSPSNQVILQALKDYGMIVADNGSPWYLSGAPSTLWSDDDLHALTRIPGSDFEAVDLTPIVTGLSSTSGPAAAGNTITISGRNFSGGAGLTQAFFGATAASAVNILSDTQMTVTVPAEVQGIVDVTVHSPYGASALTTHDRYTFTGAVTHFSISAAASSVPGAYLTIKVTALDSNNYKVTTYLGTIHFTSTDALAVLPADYTFKAGDLGGHTFSPVLETVGTRTLSVTDTANSSVTGSATVAVGSGTWIVDNGQPGYSETGSWSSATSLTHYGTNFRYSGPGTGASTAAWQVTGLAAGSYDVQLTWAAYTNRATNAPYQIYDGNTLLQTVAINQQLKPVGASVSGVVFQSLGTFTIASGSLRVVLSNNANGYVIADAMRTVLSLPSTGWIIDNGQTGYSETGSWASYTGLTHYGPDFRYTAGGTGASTATWQLTGLSAATYDVQATWAAYTNRATNAPYQIYDGSTLLATIYINQQLNPTGTSISGSIFQSLGKFTIRSGTLRVVLSNNANGYVIADAMRVVAS